MGWACGAYGWGEGLYRVLVGKPEGKRPLGRPSCRWVENIRMDLMYSSPNIVRVIKWRRMFIYMETRWKCVEWGIPACRGALLECWRRKIFWWRNDTGGFHLRSHWTRLGAALWIKGGKSVQRFVLKLTTFPQLSRYLCWRPTSGCHKTSRDATPNGRGSR